MNTTKRKAGKLMFIVYMIILMFILSIRAFSQSDTTKSSKDTVRFNTYTGFKRVRYIGYEISGGSNRYMLTSNDSRFNHLRASFSGFNLGFVYGSLLGKLRTSVGLYYSDNAVPYTINVTRANVSGSTYFMRLINHKIHAVEPYLIGGLSYVRSNIYAQSLTEGGLNTTFNNSTTQLSQVGNISWVQASTGVGLEYQLENDKQQFLHLFMEARYGYLLSSTVSNAALNQTKAHYPVLLTIGVSFGKLK